MAKKTVVKKVVAKAKAAEKKIAKKTKTAVKKAVKKVIAKTKAVEKKVAKKVTAKGKPIKKKVAPKVKRTPNAAFMKPMQISDTLAKVVGSKPIPRTEVTRKLWNYIKQNKLQDALNKRMINADQNLMAVFGGKSKVSMFEMTKLINKHLS